MAGSLLFLTAPLKAKKKMFLKDWQSPGIRVQEMTGLGVEERHCPDLTHGLPKYLNQRTGNGVIGWPKVLYRTPLFVQSGIVVQLKLCSELHSPAMER